MAEPRPQITDPTPDRRAAWGFGYRMAERDDYVFPALADQLADPGNLLTQPEGLAWEVLGPAVWWEWAQAGWRAGHLEEVPE